MSQQPQTWTIQTTLTWIVDFFAKHGIEAPKLEADLILGHILGLSRTDLIIDGQRPLQANELAEIKSLILRRTRERQPMAYLLGKKDFWSFSLRVTPDVLIPRADTECLVEAALAFAKRWINADKSTVFQTRPSPTLTYEPIDHRKAYYDALMPPENEQASSLNLSAHPTQTIRIVDVGTGSGAIALALAKELQHQAQITAVDISAPALEIAKENARTLGLDSIRFVHADLLNHEDTPIDLVVSNPPYVSESEYENLAPDLRHEPRLALVAQDEGLAIYRRLLPQAFERLSQGGALMVEIGATQNHAIERLFEQTGFTHIQTLRDYARLPRVITGIKA
ncbi:MAG: peptide chain release factor N(5)-glutamine methyltransferase [Proteobacteria bacterium]|nr:peptide chain release factor N(5)-glutamine methyltransferase [Pseudomonadota bacterium]